MWTHEGPEKLPKKSSAKELLRKHFPQRNPVKGFISSGYSWCGTLPVAMGVHCWCQAMHWPTDLEGGLGNPNVQLKGVWHQQTDVGIVTGLEKVNAIQTDHCQSLFKLPSKAHRKVDVEGKGCHVVLHGSTFLRTPRCPSFQHDHVKRFNGHTCITPSTQAWGLRVLHCHLHLRQRVLTGGILIGLGEGDGLALVPSTNSAFEWYITRSQCKPAGIGMFTGQLDASLLCNLQLVFHSFRRCSSMTRNRQLGHAVSNLHGSSFHFVWVQGLADQRGLLLLT
mmetsp:Transcript_41120/g.57263  ORF Transcript_41120/g.57263 Transcript_41120/m.57263 type:complete len:280 (-) Transcript_41120:534-1373(-)